MCHRKTVPIGGRFGGFAPAGQSELLEPYVARYFAEVPGVWERRSSEVAQTVVIGLYPSWSISEQSVAAADEFLAGDHPPALRRRVRIELSR